MKTYTLTMTVNVDSEEVPSLEELKDFLDQALFFDLDTEECGNPCGVVDIEVDLDTLQPQ